MDLNDLGYNPGFEKFRTEQNLSGFEIGRVVAEHRERYIVKTAEREYEAEITGNLRFTAQSREDFPAVGDWVALSPYDWGFAIIHKIFPRYSIIKRQAVGQAGEIQVIATNIDYAFLVQAVDRDFNINRLERYLTICNSASVIPIIVLTKIDLIPESRLLEFKNSIHQRIKQIQVLAISNESMTGYEAVKNSIQPGKTYCMLGSSGVGKSTLLNNLSGKTVMKTDVISASTQKGRHVSSHRELIVLESGGVLIDNPGMREVGVTDAPGGLEITFDRIVQLAQDCKFKDCTHQHETGCAVLESLENGEIDQATYDNYMKIQREKFFFESTLADRR
jgi:ribosome biogenesis GTPase